MFWEHFYVKFSWRSLNVCVEHSLITTRSALQNICNLITPFSSITPLTQTILNLYLPGCFMFCGTILNTFIGKNRKFNYLNRFQTQNLVNLWAWNWIQLPLTFPPLTKLWVLCKYLRKTSKKLSFRSCQLILFHIHTTQLYDNLSFLNIKCYCLLSHQEWANLIVYT